MNIPPEYEDVVAKLDAALSREAALREELAALRESYEAMRDRKNSIVDLQQRLTVAEQRLNDLAPIGRLIASQSNRSTANPMFAVLEKRETITLDTHHHDRIVWVRKDDGSIEADERTHERLELLYEDGREPKEWDRYAMLEADVFVTACFTEQGCKDYLACNGHNLRMPFIFAFGSYRNAEYNLIRDTLIGIAALKPAAEGEGS